ncbi:MAG: hypothetical protein INH41_07300 [Myxococcaceae bacterium]|jgi:hypothetical protein|nr:hypothetical protein [Myxococcaceae bacterium]MCA3012192.1 hypothetical protein [Myxococcaceae bacterium]
MAFVALLAGPARAQNVEVFVGHQRATLDVMFFKFFELPARGGQEPSRSDVLFFFRARAGVGYQAADGAPQFGLTSALSWNPSLLKGFAPVLVGQVFNRGPVAKAGVQYARVSRQLTAFSWVVSELQRTPAVDVFALVRAVHPLSELLALFFQVEALASFPTHAEQPFSFTERARVGLQLHRVQLGPALDVSHVGRGEFVHTLNVGGFARVEF